MAVIITEVSDFNKQIREKTDSKKVQEVKIFCFIIITYFKARKSAEFWPTVLANIGNYIEPLV